VNLSDRSRFEGTHFPLPSPSGRGDGGEGDAFSRPDADATAGVVHKSGASIHVPYSTLTPALSRREREQEEVCGLTTVLRSRAEIRA